jgi:hypothetical protein
MPPSVFTQADVDRMLSIIRPKPGEQVLVPEQLPVVYCAAFVRVLLSLWWDD